MAQKNQTGIFHTMKWSQGQSWNFEFPQLHNPIFSKNIGHCCDSNKVLTPHLCALIYQHHMQSHHLQRSHDQEYQNSSNLVSTVYAMWLHSTTVLYSIICTLFACYLILLLFQTVNFIRYCQIAKWALKFLSIPNKILQYTGWTPWGYHNIYRLKSLEQCAKYYWWVLLTC